MSLEARGLCMSLGGRVVVEDLDLRVGSGEIVGLLGPNGAGKTTIFRMLTGLISPDAGEVHLDGRPLKGPLYRRARLGLGYLPQEGGLFEGLTVRQQLLVPLEARDAPATEAEKWLDLLGLCDLADTLVDRLSGGERRRTEVARCLASNPRVLLLDEPFAGLDPKAISELSTFLRGLSKEGLGVLLTDHAVDEALSLVERVVLLDGGRCVLRGTPETIIRDPRARQRWLGEFFGKAPLDRESEG